MHRVLRAMAFGWAALGVGALAESPEAPAGAGVVLSWTVPDAAVELRIERGDAAGEAFEAIAVLPPTADRFVDEGPPTTQPCYRILAVRSDGGTDELGRGCVERVAVATPEEAAPAPPAAQEESRWRGPEGWYQRLRIPEAGAGEAGAGAEAPPG